MQTLNQPSYLLNQQYRDATNLNARMALHARFSTNPHSWMRWVFDHFAELPADAHILEVGCGPATLWRENLDRISAGWKVTLTDFSPGMVAQVRASLQADERFSVQLADVQELPFAAQEFDAVVANHMLYHAPDVERALTELRRVLKQDGWFFAATNGSRHMLQLHELVAAFDPALDAWAARPTRSFEMENGGALLQQRFGAVTMDAYVDGLHVTEVEPLVAYVASMWPIDEPTRSQLNAHVERAIAANGGMIEIEKASGLFIARG